MLIQNFIFYNNIFIFITIIIFIFITISIIYIFIYKYICYFDNNGTTKVYKKVNKLTYQI